MIAYFILRKYNNMNYIRNFTVLLFFGLHFSAWSFPYDTISLSGDFGYEENKKILSPFKEVVEAAEKKVSCKENLYLTRTRPERLHVSLSTIESYGIKNLIRESYEDFNGYASGYIKEEGYKGHFYGLYLFVGGYDDKGNPLHKHYSNPKSAETVKKTKYGYGKTGYKATRAHVVLRFGTNPNHGRDGQDGTLKADVTQMLSDLKNDKDDMHFKDVYEDMPSTSHVTTHATIATLKSYVGSPTPEEDPAIDLDEVLSIYRTLYTTWDQVKDSRFNRDFYLNHFKFKGQKGRRFEVISEEINY